MEHRDQRTAILFADICDSMPLYEETGDLSAAVVIARALDQLAQIAREHGGDVVRSKGDDLLCTFESPGNALDAAADMIGMSGSGSGMPAIHVGIHFGSVVAARQDIYGDAVNVAARLLQLAKPGEIVTSQDLVDALPCRERERLALLGRRSLKGKTEPLDLYSMVLDEGPATQVVARSGALARHRADDTQVPLVAVDLEYQGRFVTVRDGERCLIGRASRCGLVISDPSVSREHAWVYVGNGRATLTDQSTTGSWVLDRHGAHVTLRRESGTLSGRGTIRLGIHPREVQAAPEIAFWMRSVV